MTFQEFCVFLDSSITIIDPFLLIQLVSKSAYLFSVSFSPPIFLLKEQQQQILI